MWGFVRFCQNQIQVIKHGSMPGCPFFIVLNLLSKVAYGYIKSHTSPLLPPNLDFPPHLPHWPAPNSRVILPFIRPRQLLEVSSLIRSLGGEQEISGLMLL